MEYTFSLLLPSNIFGWRSLFPPVSFTFSISSFETFKKTLSIHTLINLSFSSHSLSLPHSISRVLHLKTFQLKKLKFLHSHAKTLYITPFTGGPIGPKLSPGVVDVVLPNGPPIAFDDFMKNFSSLAMMCLPYVYLRREFTCGRILCIRILRCVGSDTSIIFCTT